MGNLIRKRKDLFDALTSIDPEELYTHKMVNYREKSTDAFEFYTEIIAKHLLNNAEYLEAISERPRESGYKVTSHTKDMTAALVIV